MKLLKKIAALALILTFAVTAALADVDTPTDMDEASVAVADAAQTTAEPTADQTTAEQVEQAEQAERSVAIVCDAQTIQLGDTITLRAELTGYGESATTIRWLVDGVEIAGATTDTLTVTVTEQNASSVYTVEVTAA